MPFESKSQAKYLFAKHPEIAKEFARSTNMDTMAHLPEHKGDLRPEKSFRQTASDERVKTNIQGAEMDIEKFVRSGVLQQLIDDLEQLEIEGKLKPSAPTEERGEMAQIEPMSEEIPAGPVDEEAAVVEGLTDKPEMEEEDVDPRLAALIAKKKKA